MATRVARVSGVLRGQRAGEPFRGRVVLELHSDCVYYTWRLEAVDGVFLGEVGRPVSLRVIPADHEPFAFALTHAIEGIRHYRINRERPFDVRGWEWMCVEGKDS